MGPDEEAREIEEFEGDVLQMAWHNQRLAVAVEGLSDTLLYSTQINQSGLMDIELVGQLPGAGHAMFLHMKQVPGSDTIAPGSLLSIVHEDGEIQNIPLFYKVSSKLSY